MKCFILIMSTVVQGNTYKISFQYPDNILDTSRYLSPVYLSARVFRSRTPLSRWGGGDPPASERQSRGGHEGRKGSTTWKTEAREYSHPGSTPKHPLSRGVAFDTARRSPPAYVAPLASSCLSRLPLSLSPFSPWPLPSTSRRLSE